MTDRLSTMIFGEIMKILVCILCLNFGTYSYAGVSETNSYMCNDGEQTINILIEGKHGEAPEEITFQKGFCFKERCSESPFSLFNKGNKELGAVVYEGIRLVGDTQSPIPLKAFFNLNFYENNGSALEIIEIVRGKGTSGTNAYICSKSI